MGLLVDGTWFVRAPETPDASGAFKRQESTFRNWVTRGGSAGPTGEGGFVAEPGRYHLYVSLACPWAHRTLILRRLKGLEEMIGLSVVNGHMGDQGWTFAPGPGVVPDPINEAMFFYQVYVRAKSNFTGRVTVPVLWDKARGTIVSNDSAEIIRMFNSAFNGVGARAGDYYPEERRVRIDEINARVYETVNNGVYKAGFATAQAAYDRAVGELFESLDWLEGLLGAERYLIGDRITEADWRLFTTLVRFDAVYHGHFKCNIRRLMDYPNLWAYARDLYQQPGVAETVDFFHIKQHYYGSHRSLNPSGIVPAGPEIDWQVPHGRD
jgi:putative glutathione S-transferase